MISLKLVNYNHTSDIETEFIEKIKLQLDEYFTNKRQEFDIKLTPRDVFSKNGNLRVFAYGISAKKYLLNLEKNNGITS